MSKNLFVSFSGGETSAYMTQLLLREWRERYDKILVGFANTGQEAEQTLEFVDRCEKHFAFECAWIEAKINPDKGPGKGTRHKVTSFADAAREGEPFEAFIAKYGIPGPSHPQCSKELKVRPLASWLLREHGWKQGTYDEAIGIRADEAHRQRAVKGRKLVYPLAEGEFACTKEDINRFWAAQPFRLELRGYQGNCKWCWKKTLRKHLTIIEENPEWFDFPEAMERKYGTGDNPRRFFRQHRTVSDLRLLAVTTDFTAATDDKLLGLDEGAEDGCQESCDAF